MQRAPPRPKVWLGAAPLAPVNLTRVRLNTFGVRVRTAVGVGAPQYPFMATTHPCPGPLSHPGQKYSDLDMGLGLHEGCGVGPSTHMCI